MARKVGIPGCGIPQNKKSKTIHKSKHYLQQDTMSGKKTREDQFTYNLNKYGIPHDTTNIYSSLPISGNHPVREGEHFVPGGFKHGMHLIAGGENESRRYNNDVFVETNDETVPRFVPTSRNNDEKSFKKQRQETGQYVLSDLNTPTDIYKVNETQNIFNNNTFSGLNKDSSSVSYNKKYPFSNSNNKSINSSKETSQGAKKKHILKSPSFKENISDDSGFQYNSLNDVGFNNKKIAGFSEKEINHSTNKTDGIPKQSKKTLLNKHKPSSINSTINGSIWFVSPSEMGFDNKQMSVSSQREISSNLKNNVNDLSKPFTFATSTHGNEKQQSINTNDSQIHTATNVSTTTAGPGESLVSPWEMGFNNKSISTSAAREISQKTIIPTDSVSQPFASIESPNPDIFYDASSMTPGQRATPIPKEKTLHNNVISSNTGAGFSLSAPWEMGFNNQTLTTSSARELSNRTNKTVCDISQRTGKSANKKSVQRGLLAKQRDETLSPSASNLLSSGTGAGSSISTPWEMGFNNTKMSTSSAREISTHSNKTFDDMPQRSKVHNERTPGDLGLTGSKPKATTHIIKNAISSGTGAYFSLKSPWEMGFNNHALSSSSAREISTRTKKPVTDLVHNSLLASTNQGKHDTGTVSSHPKNNQKISFGYGTGMSLTSPREMGFDNKQLSSSSMREISAASNKSVSEVSSGFVSTNKKSEYLQRRSETHTQPPTGLTMPISSGANLGSANTYASPHDMGFDNKKLSTSSTREISSKTSKTVQPVTFSPSNNIKNTKNIIPLPTGGKSNFQLRNTVGYDVAFQGLSVTQLTPPLGIKGMFKSYSELYSSTSKDHDRGKYNLDLQEPLESAFMPNAVKRRQLQKSQLGQSNSNILTDRTEGEYNLMSKDLYDPRMSTNIFGSGFEKESVREKTERGEDISPSETLHKQASNNNTFSDKAFKSKGNIVALDSLPSHQFDTSPSNNESLFRYIDETKPTKNELVTLDSMTEEHQQANDQHVPSTAPHRATKNSGSVDPMEVYASPTSKTYSPIKDNNSRQTQAYWKQTHRQNQAKILKGSRRPATEDQLTGKSDVYVELNDPLVRRRSIGSVSYSQDIANYPSLIDPLVPTYGFTDKENTVNQLASNEYYVSNPLTQNPIRRSSLPLGTNLPDSSQRSVYSDDIEEKAFISEEPNDATIRSIKEATPRSYSEDWEERNDQIVHKQPVRRKSRASIVLGKFAKAVTKSTI